jgi:putative endonuclease
MLSSESQRPDCCTGMIAMGIYVYMLRCADGSYYVGSATGDDLQPRIDQHNAGHYQGYTFKRRPVVLVWSEHFDRITDGIAAERQIKGWSRAKKEALIRSDWTAISRLAQRRAGLPKRPAKIIPATDSSS